jgi:NAD(P) transhydrogenase subunit beta
MITLAATESAANEYQGLLTMAYLVAGVLLVLSLSGLSTQETAKRGNVFGIIGMTIAIAATIAATLLSGITNFAWLIPLMVVGAFIGTVLAKRVEMTSMPELVAMLHSFVGLAAVLVGLASYLNHGDEAHEMVHQIEILLGVFIGGVTFTGSIMAFGKLRGSIGSKPLLLPGRHLANAAMVIACVCPLGVQFIGAEGSGGLTALIIITVISFVLGVHRDDSRRAREDVL